MTVIASDGSPVEPIETEILVIYGGERFDVVLNANQKIGNYWIRVKGLADCRKVRNVIFWKPYHFYRSHG